MFNRVLLATFAALIWFLAAGSADAQVALRFKFTKGQTNVYEMNQDMQMAQSVMGKTIDSAVKQYIEFSTTVDEVLPDGSAKITTKMTRVKMNIAGPVEIAVDSANAKDADGNPATASMASVVKTLAKLEFTATQKPNGEMTDIKIADALLKEFRDLPGSAAMGDMFSEQGVKQMMNQSGFTLPKDPVAVGGSWTQKVALKLPVGKMSGEMKYTYQGPETVAGKTLQKITYTPTIALELDANAPIALKLTSQKGNGVIHFDNDLGRLQDLILNQTMEMTVGDQNLNLEQTMNQKTSVTLRK